MDKCKICGGPLIDSAGGYRCMACGQRHNIGGQAIVNTSSSNGTAPRETMEKYFIGFDFNDKDKPTLLVGEHNGKCVAAVKYITDKNLVSELYLKLTDKILPV